jgi:hypothetical protein
MIHFLFNYGLFNKAVSSSDYTASTDRMISEKWIGKDTEGSDCDYQGQDLKYTFMV